MKAIGFWIGSLTDERLPSPQELVGALDTPTRTAIADYLDSGLTYNQCFEYSWCRFQCGIEDDRMGSEDLTDGQWIWPQGLAHYVRDHAVLLPDEFISHALRAAPPQKPAGRSKYDDQFWVDWCRLRRKPAVLEELQVARIEAATRSSADRAQWLATLIRDKGLSSERCLWRGCRENAINGTVMCAGHSIQPHEEGIFRIHYVTGLRRFLSEIERSIQTPEHEDLAG